MNFKTFNMYLQEYLKLENKNFIYQDYLTGCFNILIQGATVKKGLDSLSKLYDKIDNKNTEQDNRTSEEIEQDIINKFKGAWG